MDSINQKNKQHSSKVITPAGECCLLLILLLAILDFYTLIRCHREGTIQVAFSLRSVMVISSFFLIYYTNSKRFCGYLKYTIILSIFAFLRNFLRINFICFYLLLHINTMIAGVFSFVYLSYYKSFFPYCPAFSKKTKNNKCTILQLNKIPHERSFTWQKNSNHTIFHHIHNKMQTFVFFVLDKLSSSKKHNRIFTLSNYIC